MLRQIQGYELLTAGYRWLGYVQPKHTLPRALFQNLILCVLLPLALIVETASALAEPQHLRREILAVYDSQEETTADETRIHRFAEMPLNYLGFVVNYWDIAKGLPPPERTTDLAGVVTWFDRTQPDDFYVWAQSAVAQGAHMVILGEGGLASVDQPSADVQALFKAIGFQISGPYMGLTYSTRVIHRDPMIGFERPLDPVLPGYLGIAAVDPAMTAHLLLQRTEGDETIQSSPVLTGPHGGFAASQYILYVEPVSEKTKWIIDPFAFFRAALGVTSQPIPDTTTLSGQRIYFSHIDGDGWNNVSTATAYRDAHKISSDVVLEQLIKPYPDLPVSVGVIGAEIDPRFGPVEAARKTAKALFELPQVEVATHSYTHPFEWSFFENYDQDREAQLVAKNAPEQTGVIKARLDGMTKRLFPNIAKLYEDDKPVEAALPRAYALLPFDLDFEVRGAVEAAQELAPAGKKTKLYLWSGMADPFESAVAATRKLGISNMNGGDTRFDPDFPSLTSVSALTRPIGAERQVYAGNANDFLYDKDGQGRDHGFVHLQATVNATEEPRRLKPFNVYYHMYAGETSAHLAAVKYNLDIAQKSALTPVAASQYAAVVNGFMTTEIEAADASTWRIRKRGALQTVRFDDAAGLTVDLAKSTGVLGQNRKGSSLYVSLDDGAEESTVALAPAEAGTLDPKVPYLIASRWQFRNLERQDCGFRVTAQGLGSGKMQWGGMKPGKYIVSAKANDQSAFDAVRDVGEDGRLEMKVEATAIEPLVITTTCAATQEQSQ